MNHPPKPTPQPFQLFSDIDPKKANIPPVPFPDPRTQAITLLSDYLSGLKFYRPGNTDGTYIEFCIPQKNVQIDFPDYEKDFDLPAMVFLAGKGDFKPNNLTPIVNERSKDVFFNGYALHIHDEYEETFTLELWAAHRSEMRAMANALSTMFQPAYSISGIRFYMQNYYDNPVIFTLLSSQIQEEADAALKRRRCTYEINMRFNILSLEPYMPFDPNIAVDVEQTTLVNPGLVSRDSSNTPRVLQLQCN